MLLAHLIRERGAEDEDEGLEDEDEEGGIGSGRGGRAMAVRGGLRRRRVRRMALARILGERAAA
jgi:hypothetical protein